MAHFYLIDDLVTATVGSTVVVTGTEARHAVTVSRVRVGESLRAGNGRGLVVEGVVREAAADRLVLEVENAVVHPAPSRRLVLVQALAKGDRDELAVQAATELGVDEVIPWSAARSVSRWEGAKVDKGRARWSAIVREATKQSIRAWQAPVGPLVTAAALARAAKGSLVLVLEPSAKTSIADVDLGDHQDVVIVVGPEGGVSDTELATLTDAGAIAVRMGESVLRTSTAGPAALAVLSMRLGRW